MKKLTYILICTCLVAALVVTALAAGSAQMTINAPKEKVAPGETVAFTVTLSAVENCRSAGVKLSYDEDVFEFLEGSCSLKDVVIASFKDGTGVFTFGEPVAVAGEIFTFRLQVKETAAAGSYSIAAKGNVRDAEGAIDTTVKGVSLSVMTEATVQTEPLHPVTLPQEETEPASQETEPEKNAQLADMTNPVYTIGTDPVAPRKPFLWWIVASVAVIAAGSVPVLIRRRRK